MMIDGYRRGVGSAFLTASAVLCVLGSSSARAAAIYKCADAAGKVTFSNLPCGDTPARPPAFNEASDYTTLSGKWHGTTQFRETVSGDQSGTLQEIANLTLQVDPGGKVVGASIETGCRVLGIAAPGSAKNLLSLDLTLSACNSRVLNQRYSGTLALYPADKIVALFVSSTANVLEGKPAIYTLKSTMRR
jgi:hypothetical protein